MLTSTLSACLYLPKPNDDVRHAAVIENFYQEWRGTNYKLGGSSKNGIDCSALMVEAYDDIYNLNLPRTTADQSALGKQIRQENLRTGDLVFFKTGVAKRHVGIYLNDGIFVHASQSDGVVKSSLASRYWSERFWKVKRLVE